MTKLTFTFISLFAAFAFAETTPASKSSVPNEGVETNSGTSDTGVVKMAKVMIVEPKDGAIVPSRFKVKFGIEGMKVAPAGTMTPGSGHHHLIIDGKMVKKGEVVPADATHLHFGKGQTETEVTLTPGPHTLTLQFADGTHISYGEMMSQTIHITVK